MTATTRAIAAPANTGHPFASFLLGLPNRVQRDFVDTYPEVQIHFVGFFLQDDYRVTRNLTLNLGLRWDLLTSPVEKSNRQTNFSLAGRLDPPGVADDRGPLTTNFYGRLGASARRGLLAGQRPDGDIAARTASATTATTSAPTAARSSGTIRCSSRSTCRPPISSRRSARVSDGLPGFTPTPLTATMVPPPGFAVFFFPAGDKPNMAHMFNVGVQRQLPWNAVLDVAYVGTRGKNIFVSRNINVPLPGPGNVNERRPYFRLVPNITVINQRSGDAESWYNALQMKLEKRFSHGLQALVAYTYSRSEDTAFILHPAIETRAPSIGKAIDIPQNLVVSWAYELPFGPG